MININIRRYSYIYIKRDLFSQYFSAPQSIQDEGSILRLADLHIISKSDIASIEEKSGVGENTYIYYAQKCSDRIVITLKNNEVIELGIVNVK